MALQRLGWLTLNIPSLRAQSARTNREEEEEKLGSKKTGVDHKPSVHYVDS
jgi:hypothetical protein